MPPVFDRWFLTPGDKKEFDVNNDGSNDLSITLNEIAGGRAEIVYKMLAKPKEEKLPEEEIKEEEKIEEEPIVEVKEEKKSKAWLLIGGLGCLLVGLIVGWFYLKKKK